MGYWYVREQPSSGLFHIVEDDIAGTFRTRPVVRAICGQPLVSEQGEWEAQYEGEVSGWPICAACRQRIAATTGRS